MSHISDTLNSYTYSNRKKLDRCRIYVITSNTRQKVIRTLRQKKKQQQQNKSKNKIIGLGKGAGGRDRGKKKKKTCMGFRNLYHLNLKRGHMHIYLWKIIKKVNFPLGELNTWKDTTLNFKNLKLNILNSLYSNFKAI